MPKVYEIRPAATLSVRWPGASNGVKGRRAAAASWPYSVDVMPTMTPHRFKAAACSLQISKVIKHASRL